MWGKEDNIIACLAMIFALICLAFGVFMGYDALQTDQANVELQNKVEFYEQVIEDFGIDEFVEYPNIWYDTEYRDQIKKDSCLDILE